RLALREDQVASSAVVWSASASARHAGAGDHAAALADAEAGLALWGGATRADSGGDEGLGGPAVDPARGAGIDAPVAAAGSRPGAVAAGSACRGGRGAGGGRRGAARGRRGAR